MPKAGSYEYPRFDVDFVLDKLRKVHVVLKGEEANRSVFAETLEMSPTGGAFAHVVASMEKYGLVETGGGRIVLTDLGKTCLYGEPSEAEAAVSKAVANVPLFREIFALHGVDAKEESIRAFLRNRAQLDPAQAQQAVPQVFKVYRKIGRYLSSKRDPVQAVEETGPRGISLDVQNANATQSKTQMLKIQFGDLYIQLPPHDEQAIELAIQTLEMMQKRKPRDDEKRIS